MYGSLHDVHGLCPDDIGLSSGAHGSDVQTRRDDMSDLVRRLSEGKHPVQISLRPDRTVKALKESIDRGYVHVKFTGTRGGTELGVPLDRERSDLSAADFQQEQGRVTIVGELSLDYVKVRCRAEVELPSMEGLGALEPLEQGVEAV